MDKVRRGMSELNTERQHPEQLGLFKDDDFIQQIIKQKIFLSHGDDLRYFQEGKVPPNDKDKYYFGVKFSDEEHKLLITIFRKPKDVLDFYLQVWKNNETGKLNEVAEIFDRNKADVFVREVLSDRYVPMINVDLIISAAKKIVNKLKKDTQLSNIIKKYEKISAQKKMEEVHLRGNGGKNDKGSERIEGSSNRGEKARSNRDEVIGRIGGWNKVWGLVDSAIVELYANNQYRRGYVWRSIITNDYIRNFVNEISGIKNLSYNERIMIEGIVRGVFEKKRQERERRLAGGD
jgi:hypothetical protein